MAVGGKDQSARGSLKHCVRRSRGGVVAGREGFLAAMMLCYIKSRGKAVLPFNCWVDRSKPRYSGAELILSRLLVYRGGVCTWQ